MEILSFEKSRLRNKEHFQFQTEFKDLVEKLTPAALNIEAKFTHYLPRYTDEGVALDIMIKSAITDELADADNTRDTTFSGAIDVVKSGLKHFDNTVKDAAKKLMLVFDHFGNVSIEPYNEETAAINKLIKTLNDEHPDDVAKVGLTAWLAELQSNNDAFEALMKARYSEEAGKTQLRMKKVRLEVDDAYRKIIKRIEAIITLDEEADYNDFINELNERIEYAKNIIARR